MPGTAPPPDLHLSDMLDSISDAVVVISADWQLLYVNRAYMTLVERLYTSPDQIIGGNLWELYPDIKETKAGQLYQRAMATQQPGMIESFYQPLKVWLEVRAFPSPGALTLYVRNITERKTHEAEVLELTNRLREQAGMFDTVLSNLPDICYAFDTETRVIYANKPLLKLWGRKLPDVVGKTLFELNYPHEMAVRLTAELRSVIDTGVPVKADVTYVDADGVEDIHDYIYNPILNADGAVVGVAGTTRLVTERRNAEKAIRQLATIVESSDDAIVSTDLEGVIQSWNQGAERLLGYTAEEVVGKSIFTLIPDDRHNEEHSIIARTREGERIEHFETLRRHKSGRLVPVSLSVSPIRDNKGNVIGASKIARDITEQKAINLALRHAKEAAEAANRSKDKFLAVLSHELRTPLTPALMTVGALERAQDFPEEFLPDVAMIRRNIELETKLIDDLLDLSRIINGKLNLNREAVDFNGLVKYVCEICRPQIAEKELIVHTDLDSTLSLVDADSSRLQQVLWNVVKNAAKFTQKGGHISIVTRAAGEYTAEVAVKDTGLGIESQNLVKIFEAFEQGDPKTTRQFGGLGLGLAISKVIMELHGGSIEAESDGPGAGSRFIIRLPIYKGTPAQAPTPKPRISRKKTRGNRLLLVEDHPDTALTLARALRGAGYEIKAAGTVEEALQLAQQHRFDVVVSDIGLPDATGYELMKQLRKAYKLKGIAMSGYGMEHDIRKSLEAGFETHLVKPVDFTRLENALRDLLE